MAEYLAETIESVLVNLRPGDEYFVIDGGSSDSSLEVIQRYADRITGWVSEPDRGYADALRKGFERSNAGYQCWINSGDLLLSGALAAASEHLATTGADMIFGDDLYIDENGRVLQVSNGQVDDLLAMMLYGGWTPLQDACYWRRSLYEKVGGIDPLQRYAADYDLFLRMSLNGICQYVPTIFSAFRRHTAQTSNVNAKEYQRERERCRRRELDRFSKGSWCQVSLNAVYWWKVRWRARMAGRKNNMAQLIGEDVAGLRCQPFENLTRS